MTTDTTPITDEPLAAAELAAIKARYDAATGGAWYFEEQYGPHFLASEHHGYMHGIGDLIGFGDGEQADADRDDDPDAKPEPVPDPPGMEALFPRELVEPGRVFIPLPEIRVGAR